MILSDYPHLAIVSSDQSAIISDRVKVTIKCTCGAQVIVSTRALVRKWKDKPAYLCKSCHIKTYASDPGRIEKFKRSFAVAASTAEYKAKASDRGKAVWADSTLRSRITEAVRQDNIVNPKKAVARAIANKALMAKAWYKDHMLKMRESAHDSLRRNLVDNKELRDLLASNFKINDPTVKAKHRITTSAISKARWQDPIYRQHMKEVLSSPEVLAKLSASSKIKWLSTDYRAKMMALYATAEFKAKQSAISKEINSRPNVKQAKALALQNQPSISKLEDRFAAVLDDLGINYTRQHFVGWHSFDFLIQDSILVEVNGDYFHGLHKQVARDSAKATYITRYSQYQFRTIWEHEFDCQNRLISRINEWLGVDVELVDFDFNEVSIIANPESSADVKLLLSKYHYLGKIGHNSLIIEFRLNNVLIGCTVFGPISRVESAHRLNMDHNSILELSRVCIMQSYQKKNFASWMLSKSAKIVKASRPKIKQLLTFADQTFGHSGTIYKAAGWKYDGDTSPSYYYRDQDGFVMHKKTLYNRAVSCHMKEAEFAVKHGYKKVRSKAKSRFLLTI